LAVAALDAGTTGVRCMIVDSDGKVIAVSRRSWSYDTPELFEVAKEFVPEKFWKLASTVIQEAVDEAAKKKQTPIAIATTSQRHGMVLLDEDGKELHGGPNIDARGSMTQYVIEDEMGEEYYSITGCWPPMMFAPSRIAWFEEDEPEIHEKIAQVLPINDWLTYRLSGVYITEPSTASGTGFYDLKKKDWSQRILDVLGLERSILPEIKRAGEVIGEISEEVEKECSLPKGIPVVQGGTDTHCALLAAATELNEIGIIAGSTGPVMLITDSPRFHSEIGVWIGSHMVPGQWTIESNATMTGAVLEWVVRLLCEQSKNPVNCETRLFSNLDDILKEVPPGSNETLSGLGPNIMETYKFTDVPLARMYFPQPALPSITPLNSASMIHSVMENIAFSFRGNCEQLYHFSDISSIKAIGGMSQSKIWGQMLANVLGRDVKVPVQSEGSLLGAAICASVGVGLHQDFDAASKKMIQWKQTFTPDDRAQEYEGYYSRWKQLWLERE
jgi:autoinducer 2 (AI-2) kinase